MPFMDQKYSLAMLRLVGIVNPNLGSGTAQTETVFAPEFGAL